jgi:hypothetical protein
MIGKENCVRWRVYCEGWCLSGSHQTGSNWTKLVQSLKHKLKKYWPPGLGPCLLKIMIDLNHKITKNSYRSSTFIHLLAMTEKVEKRTRKKKSETGSVFITKVMSR